MWGIMATIDDLIKELKNFNSRYPRPKIGILELSAAYDIRVDFTKVYPGTEFPGVYVISKVNGEILRIGKASCSSSLGKRLSSYYRWHDKKYIGVGKYEGYTEAFIIHTISLPQDRAFEAPAIEEYLIDRLKPPYNKVGK